MIINLGWVLSVDWGDEHNGELCSLESKRAKKVLDPTWHDNWLENVRREIEQMRHVCSDGVILKVSIESSHLNPVQKVKLCQVTAEAGADYVKLSSSGRELTDYYRETLLKRYSRPDIKIIGSVFINDSSLTSTKRLLDAGCDRVGSAGLMNELVCDENLARAIKFHIENSIPFLEPEPYRTSNTNPMNIYCDNMFGIFTEPVAGLFQRR